MSTEAQTFPLFHGATFNARLDAARLTSQAARVLQAVKDGAWRTLAEIHELTGYPEASISARLRDYRRPEWGGFKVERRRRGVETRGLFEYRVVR